MNKIDTRVKLYLVLCLSSLSVVIKDLALLTYILITIIAIHLLSIKTLKRQLSSIVKLFSFIAVIAIIQLIFNKTGNTAIKLFGIISITEGGINEAASIFIRMLIITVSALLLSNEGTSRLMKSLTALKLPYELVFMVYIGIKFIPLFREEFKNSLIAVQLAGAETKKVALSKKLKLYTYILTPAVLSAVIKAKHTAIAAECRGFRLYSERTSYNTLKMKKIDCLLIVLISIYTMIFLFLKLY